MSPVRAAVLCVFAGAVACGPSSSPPAPKQTYGALSGEIARVGDERLDEGIVTALANARAEPPRAALDALVEDSLLARGARARGLDGTPEVLWGETSLLARQTATRFMNDARAKGPPTDDELMNVKVVRAVVLRTKGVPEARSRFAAQAIADAVARASSVDDFQARAKAVSTDQRTTVEVLPAFDAAGHFDGGGEADVGLVAAALALRAPGDTSPVFPSAVGWDVIRLIDRERPQQSLDELRVQLAEPVIELRARIALSSVLAAHRRRTRIEIATGAEETMALTFPAR
jgi:hypothetical protein